MKVKDVDIEFRQFDPHADAYLVYGQVKDREKTLKNHVVGWQPRHGDYRLLEPRYFLDHDSAMAFYLETISDDYQPDRKTLEKDWQKRKVYDWEDTELERYKRPLSKKEIKDLVRQVANDYGIKVPKVEWYKKQTFFSEYKYDSHTVAFGHRDNITTLHEMAHALHRHAHSRDKIAYHTPGFVWIATELYHRYTGAPLNTLITSAHQQGLLGDLETGHAPLTIQRAPKKQAVSPGCK